MIEGSLVIGGKPTPFFLKILADARQAGRVKTMLQILKTRFGSVPPTVAAGLEQVQEEDRLFRLIDDLATCPSLQAFKEALRQELPAPPPVSPRGKRRPRKPSA